MGQREVYEVLKDSKGWITTEDISKLVPINKASITESLRRLSRAGDIKVKKLNGSMHTYLYKMK